MLTGLVPFTRLKVAAVLFLLAVEGGLVVLSAPNLFMTAPSPICSGISPEFPNRYVSLDLLRTARAVERSPKFLALTGGACFEWGTFYTYFNSTGSYTVLVFDHFNGLFMPCHDLVARFILAELQIIPHGTAGDFEYKWVLSPLNIYSCPANG